MLSELLTGLVTSVISGGIVWLWQRGRTSRALHRKAAFFGLEKGKNCLVVMNNKHNQINDMARNDVFAVLSAVELARSVGCPVSLRPSDGFTESNGNRTEFCIGGPEGGSNVRSGGHMAAWLPGASIHPFDRTGDSNSIVVGEHIFSWERGREEHALVAKFTPPRAVRPVILICGQSSLANRAAMDFLEREHRTVAKAVRSVDRFCVIVRVPFIATYGHEAAVLERDVSEDAFASALSVTTTQARGRRLRSDGRERRRLAAPRRPWDAAGARTPQAPPPD